ncbi:serine carboxypeptidase-like protein [Striga asiatica]|uniref:Carboxypeptidase n=1 Tax=Striga asiatica TaxID=4170 RepID=A0A5A7R3I6_STRAF|nr:serine carboxypeptidase-like protein [Striga asiatica]
MGNMKNTLTIFSILCLMAYVTECLCRRGNNNPLREFMNMRNLRKQSNHPFLTMDDSNDFKSSSVYVASQTGMKEADKIKALPGQPKVSFSQYSGYVTVDQKAGRALFYYFVEAAENPTNKPLVLWLQGGPGCSSMGYGAMSELGPFRVNSNGETLWPNKNSWNNGANVLFLESPAGVGFSYSNRSSDYVTGDKKTAEDSYTFLVNWLQRFPEYKTRVFYITGESYAGHYVPQLANLILRNNKIISKKAFYINLKGIAMGNAYIDSADTDNGIMVYLWSHALISNETYQGVQKNCDFSSHKRESNLCRYYKKQLNEEIGNIYPYNIYASLCGSSKQFSSISNFDPCTDHYVLEYLNNPQVQKALHANTTHISRHWDGCNDDILYNWKDGPDSVLPLIKSLMTSGIRIWFYSGDLDTNVPFTATLYSLAKIASLIETRWYPWYVNEEVGGYAVGYENVTFVTVRGAGHFVPSYQPERALILFTSFLKGKLPRGKKGSQI